ncbi:hypothetical protein [Nocardia farcinica]
MPDTIVAGSPDAWAQLVRPAARPQAEVDAERRTGVEWLAELREWFSLHDGGGSADLLPGMTLLGLEQMIDVHAMQCDAYPPTWSSLSAMLADLTTASPPARPSTPDTNLNSTTPGCTGCFLRYRPSTPEHGQPMREELPSN